MMFTVSSVTLPQTQTQSNHNLGLNHKTGGRGCAERCEAELGPVAGADGPIWGGVDYSQDVLRDCLFTLVDSV